MKFLEARNIVNSRKFVDLRNPYKNEMTPVMKFRNDKMTGIIPGPECDVFIYGFNPKTEENHIRNSIPKSSNLSFPQKNYSLKWLGVSGLVGLIVGLYIKCKIYINVN